jgi:succinate-semialdehyde dehydrogenase/glutarate-semialdehyde dehydrogenase
VSAGQAIATRAGSRLKKTVLELGGSDPYVVLEDCDLERTVETCVRSRLINSGQSCIAAKRYIVVESVRRKFEELFVARMEAQTVDDPLDPATTVGPLARRDLRDDLHAQVERSVAQGCEAAYRRQDSRSFGLVLSTHRSNRRPQGWRPATRKRSALWPRSLVSATKRSDPGANDSALAWARRLHEGPGAGRTHRNRGPEAGSCFVNEFVKSDPRLPFGGIKDSGYGRELSVFGIREFVNIKTVYVA